jgi:hypothetical protein
MKGKIIQVVFAVMMVSASLFAMALPASAGTINGTVNMSVDCSGILFSGGGSVTFDRDTNGNNTETLIIEARDGADTVIFTVPDTRSLGSNAGFAPLYSYITAPADNPITARVFSPAGNGFPEQVLLSTVGTCASLESVTVPTMNQWGMVFFIIFAGVGAVLYLKRQSGAKNS